MLLELEEDFWVLLCSGYLTQWPSCYLLVHDKQHAYNKEIDMQLITNIISPLINLFNQRFVNILHENFQFCQNICMYCFFQLACYMKIFNFVRTVVCIASFRKTISLHSSVITLHCHTVTLITILTRKKRHEQCLIQTYHSLKNLSN